MKQGAGQRRNRGASLFVIRSPDDTVPGNDAGARHGSAGRAGFVDIAAPTPGVTHGEQVHYNACRNSAARDHNANTAAPGADSGRTQTNGRC